MIMIYGLFLGSNFTVITAAQSSQEEETHIGPIKGKHEYHMGFTSTSL